MSETEKNELCPCGSGKKYAECCEPIIKGTVKAPTAEALMRARYTSYVKQEIDFIINTCEKSEEIAAKYGLADYIFNPLDYDTNSTDDSLNYILNKKSLIIGYTIFAPIAYKD